MLDALWQMTMLSVLEAGMPPGPLYVVAAAGTAFVFGSNSLQKNIFASLCKELKLACKAGMNSESAVARVAHELGLLKGSSHVMMVCVSIFWFNAISVQFADDGSGSTPGLALYASFLTAVLVAVFIKLLWWHATHRFAH